MIHNQILKLASIAALAAVAVGCGEVEENTVATSEQTTPVAATSNTEPVATKTVTPVSAQVVNLNVKGMT